MFHKPISESIIERPEDHDEIQKEARKLLKRAEAIGIFPTPIEKLMAAASIEQVSDIEEIKASFLRSIPKQARAVFDSAWSKLRGFADLKKKVNYIAPDKTPIREIWPKLHELGHQVLPWQQVNSAYMDDQKSLSPECEERFDQEANDFAGEILFQGTSFKDMANGLYPEFSTIFHLSETFGASRHSTARHFAEESDEPVALVSYYPSRRTVSEDGRPTLILGKAHSASQRFIQKYPDLQLPYYVAAVHPWAASIEKNGPVSGTEKMDCGDGTNANFLWETWWNKYTLLVLIRKSPKLKIVRNFF